MMTMTRAYDLLRERWPGRSFCIGVDVWYHTPTDRQEIIWTLYDADDRVHYYGPSLESVMEQGCGCDADLAGVDARLERLGPYPHAVDTFESRGPVINSKDGT